MLPKAQPLFITRFDGTVSVYRNSELIPLFYLIPKSMLEKAGKEFLEIPRKPVDFMRKWYHPRSKHPIVSLEAEIEKHAEYNDGQELEFGDANATTEEQILSKIMVKQFMESLSEKGRKILKMRLVGYTLEEIAQELGYKNHSGVQKRITKIGLAYQEFTKDDLGFGEEN